MSAYVAVDIENCRRLGHRFIVAGSDKTPLKRNIICDDCSSVGKTAYAAYGDPLHSWGQWRPPLRKEGSE